MARRPHKAQLELRDDPPSAWIRTPTVYKRKLADTIITGMEDGKSMAEMCRRTGIGGGTFLQWVHKDRDGLSERYARARERQAAVWADEVVGLADSAEADGKMANVELLRHRIDARKWVAAKILSKIYGDKSQQEHSGTLTINIRRFGDNDGDSDKA